MKKLEDKLNKTKETIKSGLIYGTLGLCSYVLLEYLICKTGNYGNFNQEYLTNNVPVFYENLPKAFFIFGGIGAFFKLDEE
ncbi:MAG: hypothetical protein PHH53_00490 [Candidatus Nanoarchaeia archaeon]|nr:hypothetical protein [Candidatus Nanoarchaeia archaeon]